MEFTSQTLNQLPLPQMEPIGHWAPYLSGLDFNDAIESFAKLADSLLFEQDPDNMTNLAAKTGNSNEQQSPRAASQSTHWSSALTSSNLYQKYQLSPSTSWSDASSSQWLSSAPSVASGASSPAASEPQPNSWGYCSSTPSSDFSGPASVASSCSSGSGSGSGRNGIRKRPHGERRQRNAHAAERYRRKLKGRECGLAKEMERELELNMRLKRETETKLALYREFVTLLANKTSQNDAQLANLGARSLMAVLSPAANHQAQQQQQQQQQDQDYPPLTPDVKLRCELEQQLVNFQRIVASCQSKAKWDPQPSAGRRLDVFACG